MLGRVSVRGVGTRGLFREYIKAILAQTKQSANEGLCVRIIHWSILYVSNKIVQTTPAE
jgi:hypothetical protein